MSLDTVPKTNFDSDDGVLFSDFNEVGANLQALEDSKYESGDDVVLGDITAEDITADDISATDISATDISTTTQTTTTSNITTLNMAGATNPALTLSSSQVIGASSAWVPARGSYIVSGGTLQINVSGWKSVNVGGGSFFTDGSNVRIFDSGGSGVTVYYLKF